MLTSDFNQDQKAPWWWSSDDRNMFGVNLSVLVGDIWINVLLQTSALVGPLYICWGCLWRGCWVKHLVGSGTDKVQRDGRRLHIEELHEFHASTYITGMIKSRKMRWIWMWYQWETCEIRTGSLWGNLRRRTKRTPRPNGGWEGVDIKISPKVLVGRIGLIWLRMREVWCLMRTEWWHSCSKNEGNLLTGETLLPSQKGLCSVEIVSNVWWRKQVMNQ
jgi:hypothetical protein